jgi:hypothetical protein
MPPRVRPTSSSRGTFSESDEDESGRRVSEPAVDPVAGPSLEDFAALLNNAISPLANQLQQTQTELARVSEESARLSRGYREVVAEPATEESAGGAESEAERRARELQLAQTGAEQAAAAAAAAAAAVKPPLPPAEEKKVSELSVEDLEILISRRLGQVNLDLDSIPLLETSRERPETLFRLQRKGEFVVTNLLTAAEFERCIPGYKAFRGQPGSAAELENLYVSTLRLEDVLDHFIAADRGEVELDLPRAIDVLTEVHALKNERLEGLLERAYVRDDPSAEDTDAKVIASMEEKRRDRMRPVRSNTFRKEQLSQREAVKAHKAKFIAQAQARKELAREGLDVPGRAAGGGGGAAGVGGGRGGRGKGGGKGGGGSAAAAGVGGAGKAAGTA